MAAAVDVDAVLTCLGRRVDIGSVVAVAVAVAERGQTVDAGESGEKGKIRRGNIESRIMNIYWKYRLWNIIL